MGVGRLVLRFLDHTQLVGLLWTSNQPFAKAATYKKHNKHKNNNYCVSGIRTCDPRNRMLQTNSLERETTEISCRVSSDL
jgi:hypothetical protein